MRKIVKICLLMCLIISGVLSVKDRIYAEELVIDKLQAVPDLPAVAAKVNGDGSEVLGATGRITYKGYTKSNQEIEFDLQWDYSSLNLNTVGAYIVKGVPLIPDGYVLAEGLTLPVFEVGVSVQESGKPDINVYQKMTAARLFVFPWLTNSAAETWQIWIKKEGGEWYDAAAVGYAMCDSDGLYLPGNVLVAGNTYYMAVRGDGIATKTLKFLYKEAGSLTMLSYSYSDVGEEGKRDTCISSYDTEGVDLYDRCFARAVPVGTTSAYLQKYLQEKEAVSLSTSTKEHYENTFENPEILLNVQWDISEVDLSNPGVYRITGTFSAPKGYILKEGIVLPKAYGYISVQQTRKPELDTWHMNKQILGIPFLMQGFTEKELSECQVLLRKEGEEFTECSKEIYDLSENMLWINMFEYEIGTRYGVQVIYPDGETKLFTFEYDYSVIKDVVLEGRNYSDREEEEIPDIMQEAEIPSAGDGEQETQNGEDMSTGEVEANNIFPEINTENSAEDDDESNTENSISGVGDSYTASTYSSGTSSVSSDTYSEMTPEAARVLAEVSSRSKTVISGKRLADMMENSGNTAVFEKESISLVLPQSALSASAISSFDEIQVSIQKTSESSFSVRIFVNGAEITEIPGTVVRIPWNLMDNTLKKEELLVLDITDQEQEYVFETTRDVLKVSIDKTGDYFLRNPGAEAAAEISENETADEPEIVKMDETDGPALETEEKTENNEKEYHRILWSAAEGLLILLLLLLVLRKRKRGE